MFDVSFVELLILGVVALVVLGPEKLPAAARTLGALVRKARQSWQSVRGEFERELATEELARSIRDTRRELDVAASLRETADELRSALEPSANAAQATLREAADAVRHTPASTPAATATPASDTPPASAPAPAPATPAQRAPHD
jgi:sec-independent protein translocase protein TatB